MMGNRIRLLEMHLFMSREGADTSTPRLNAMVLDGDVCELCLDFTKLQCVHPSAVIPCAKALLIFAVRMREKQPDFHFRIMDWDSEGFRFLLRSGFFLVISQFCAFDSAQQARIQSYLSGQEYNPEHILLPFEDFRYYADTIRASFPNELGMKTDAALKEDELFRNQLDVLVYRKIEETYKHSLREERSGDEHLENVLRFSLVEPVSNAILHSGSGSLLYFQRDAGLQKKNKKDPQGRITGLYVIVGDIGKGLTDSLGQKEDKEYYSEYKQLRTELMGHIYVRDIDEKKRQRVKDLFTIIEAICYARHKYEKDHKENLYTLINAVTLLNGCVTINYGHIEVTFDQYLKYREQFIAWIQLICDDDIIYDEKYGYTISSRCGITPGFQIEVEIPVKGPK